MPHVRQQIREVIQATLLNLPTTGNRVFVHPVYPFEKAMLPGLAISTLTDEADVEKNTASKGRVHLFSRLQLSIRAYCKGTSNVDDVLDQIEAEVRMALMRDITLGGKAKDINWLRTELTLSGQGEQPIAMTEMVFSVEYRIADNAPDIALT